MYVYMYVCMYVCVCVCVCMYYIYIYIYIYVCLCVCVYIYIYIYVYSVLRPHIFTYLRTLLLKLLLFINLLTEKKKNVGLNKDASIGGKMTIFGVSSFAADTGRKTPVLAEKDASIGRKCQNCARVTAALK